MTYVEKIKRLLDDLNLPHDYCAGAECVTCEAKWMLRDAAPTLAARFVELYEACEFVAKYGGKNVEAVTMRDIAREALARVNEGEE